MGHSTTVSCSPPRAGTFATDVQWIKQTGSGRDGCRGFLHKLLSRLPRQAGAAEVTWVSRMVALCGSGEVGCR